MLKFLTLCFTVGVIAAGANIATYTDILVGLVMVGIGVLGTIGALQDFHSKEKV